MRFCFSNGESVVRLYSIFVGHLKFLATMYCEYCSIIIFIFLNIMSNALYGHKFTAVDAFLRFLKEDHTVCSILGLELLTAHKQILTKM